MARTIWRYFDDSAVYNLLIRMDGGYLPDKEEQDMLAERKGLNLVFARITALPESIGKLKALESLDLGLNSGLTALPESIGNLAALRFLDLSGTWITALPETIGRLKALKSLYLGGTQIAALPESIGELKALENLDLSGTQITALPERIGEFPNLRKVNLAGLKLDRIPGSLGLKGLPFIDEVRFSRTNIGVNLHGATLSEQDVSIFLESPSLIPILYEGNMVTLRECKVIFLGDGDSGKSYTIRRIENDGKKEHYDTSMTPGVEISDWDAKGEDGLKIHFWDFGGQELLHSMHRCFLTDKTCYVVTVKSRETNADFRARYWLGNVTAFAPDSPVILFINCWDKDDGKRVIDETRLKRDFKNIKVVYCSAKEATQKEFISKLSDTIVGVIKDKGYDKQETVKNWRDIAKDIKERNNGKPYLTKSEYYELCRKNDITDAEAPELLSYLNRLGICFSYHKDAEQKELAEYKLLQPIWLTNAVYAIIREGMDYAQEGQITDRAIKQMLGNPPQKNLNNEAFTRASKSITYRAEECSYVIDVAAAQKLCFRVSRTKLFFPALLKKDSPDDALEPPLDYPDHVEYRFEYEYLPDSVVHKLMIRFLSIDVTLNACWLRGLVLGVLGDYKAVIRIDDDNDRTLHVDIYSKKGKPASGLFPLIRREIIKVNYDLRLTASESIAIGEDEFTLTQLVGAYKDKDAFVRGPKTGSKHSPFELLNSFYDAPMISGINVDENGAVYIETSKFNKVRQDDDNLRNALYDVYEGKCFYTKRKMEFSDMQIDHVLAKRHIDGKDNKTRMYLARLEAMGFDLDDPDYVENYLPCCGAANRDKTNEIREAETLMHYHEQAMKNASKVLERKKYYERMGKNRGK